VGNNTLFNMYVIGVQERRGAEGMFEEPVVKNFSVK
jgi:hypothetical protein